MGLGFAIVPLLLGVGLTFGLAPYLFAVVGKAIGTSMRSRAQHRIDILTSRALTEESEQQALEKETANFSGRTTASSSSLDSDWEQINEGGSKTPTAQQSPDTLEIGKSVPGPSKDYDGRIGFFHPFCNAGGGGERVLYAAILATQQQYPRALCIVYSGDHESSKAQILENVRNRFNIHLDPARIVFLYLTTREYVLASRWPRFTLLGQSLGSLILGWEALSLLPPDVFVDTMGYAFTMALSKWLFPDVPTAAYVHYPTISTDMLHSLHEKEGHGLNAGSGKGMMGKAKQIYWELFARLYSWVGGSLDIVMTNSNWTQDHISQLWGPSRKRQGKKHDIGMVYPPCAVEELQEKVPVNCDQKRTNNLLYIAQFRPEKMHQTIIEAFHVYLRQYHKDTPAESRPRLILVGSVRDDQDEKLVYKLRIQAQEIKDSVDFVVNAKWPKILELLRSSSVGVNGMWNEHFGIGVVEYQAAGLISVVNNSGGPKKDIVVPIDWKPTGFHALTPDEYAEGFHKALSLSTDEALAMRQRARQSSLRFTEQVFRDAWVRQLELLIAMLPNR